MSTIPRKSTKQPKLSKKERAELARLQALEAEQEALRLAELARQQREKKRQEAIEQAKKDTIEQSYRYEQLKNTYEIINEITNYNLELIEQVKEQKEWKHYVESEKLPYPVDCGAMNTYLHLWEKEIESTTVEDAVQRTKDVLQLLKELDYRIFTASIQEKKSKEKNWRWIRGLFQTYQATSLDVATYRLLRDIDKYLNRLDIQTADYNFKDQNFAISLWLKVPLPIPLPNPRRQQKASVELDFPDIKINLQFPQSLQFENLALRVLYLIYDHLSVTSQTFEDPDDIKNNQQDMIEAITAEWNEKLKTMPSINGQNLEMNLPVEDVMKRNLSGSPRSELSGKTDSDSSSLILTDDVTIKRMKAHLIKHLPEDEINLRKFAIIGGVYNINLLKQPPQPKKFVKLEVKTTTLCLPTQLEYQDYYIHSDIPKNPEAAGATLTPEQLEAHMKKTEQELDKLIYITLTWPNHVYFFELPIVCQWDEKKKVWSKKDIHDVKHNEEKGQLTFRTGKFGVLGLAALRYSNLPFQAWELFPEADGTVIVQVTCAILLVEFKVLRNGSIILLTFQNSPDQTIMDDIVGVEMELYRLILIMQERGVDIFPRPDTICYVSGVQPKHWVTEKHLYFNMAQLALVYNFTWSRWNISAGYRNIVIQMREYIIDKSGKSRNDKRYRPIKQRNFSMLLVTPSNASFVQCTEVSQIWNNLSVENIKFAADLWHLVRSTAGSVKIEKIDATPKELVWTIYQLLINLKLNSYS